MYAEIECKVLVRNEDAAGTTTVRKKGGSVSIPSARMASSESNAKIKKYMLPGSEFTSILERWAHEMIKSKDEMIQSKDETIQSKDEMIQKLERSKDETIQKLERSKDETIQKLERSKDETIQSKDETIQSKNEQLKAQHRVRIH